MTQHTPTTVLLIEDSPSDVRLVEELLRQSSRDSFHVLTASTLAKGLELLSENSVDALLLDLGLPDSQGIDTLRAVHKRVSHLPTIVLTVSDDETLGEQALEEGAQRFLSKDALTLGASYAGVFSRMIRFAIAQARAETALVESEGHFHSLFNSSAIAQIYYDATGYPIRANAATLALFGIADVSALQHMTIFSSPRMSDDDKARLRGGEPVEYEQAYDFDAIKASGGFETTNSGTRHVHIFFTPLHNSQTGGIDGYLGQITEITERVRAERLLREAHQNVQALNEALRVANEELEQRVQERTAKLSETAARLKEEVSTRQQAEAAVKHRAHELKVINDIMMIGSTARDLSSLLSSILTKTLDFTDLEVGHVRLLHNDTLVLECAHGLPPEYVEEQREISIHDPLFASLFRTGKPRFEEDFESVEPVRASASSLQTAGAVPLMAGKEMIGVIGVGSQQRRHLSKEQKELLGLIGREAGTVVAKMRAEESAKEHARRQDILTQVITAGNKASDLETACAAMLDTAMELIPATAGIISLLNEAADATELQYSRGLTDEVRDKARRLPLTNPNFVDVYHGKPLFMDDYTQQGTEQFRPLLPHLRITALVPLVEQSRVIGHYALSSERTQPFTEEERALLVAIGQQAGTVIARLQAETQIREYSEHLEDLVAERTAQLAQSEEYFRTLFESSSIAQLRYNADGIVIRVNHAAKEFLGIQDVSEVQSLSIWTSPRILEEDKARLREGHPIHYEQVYDFATIRESGQFLTTRSDVRYVEIYMLPLFSASDNTVEGYFAQLIDITERKEAEDSLSQEAAVKSALANLYVPLIDPKATIEDIAVAILQQAKQLTRSAHGYVSIIDREAGMVIGFGHSPMMLRGECAIPEAQGQVPVPIPANGVFPGLWGHAFNTKRGFYTNAPSEHPAAAGLPEGHVPLTRLLSMPVLLGDEVVGGIALANPEPEREYTDRDLEACERFADFYALAINRMRVERERDSIAQFPTETPDPVLRFALDGAVLYANEPGETLINTTSFPLDEVREHCVEVYTAGVERMVEVTDGAHTYEFTFVPVTERRYVNVYAKDITERKRIAAALQNAERLAGIGETAAMIGHDLRNPLQGLQYIVDLQKLRFDKVPPDKRSREDWEKEQVLFDRISGQISYMDKIVGDLQDYARPLEAEHEAVTVDTLINDVLESLPHADNVTIVTDSSDLTIDADPHLMHRVFANLLLNAIQAMPNGGTLTIGAKAIDGIVSIDVSDTGVGIPADMHDKLFSPLTTGKAKGTGLGLAVVKRIVEAHNGTITFESEEGKGTTFTITLPQADG